MPKDPETSKPIENDLIAEAVKQQLRGLGFVHGIPESIWEKILPTTTPKSTGFIDPASEYFIRNELEKLESRLKLHFERELRQQLHKFIGIVGVMMTLGIVAFAGIANYFLRPQTVEKVVSWITGVF